MGARAAEKQQLLIFIKILYPPVILGTHDFVDKVKLLRVLSEAYLFSLDVDSLYTNTETDLGLKAVWDYFSKYPDASWPDKAIFFLS